MAKAMAGLASGGGAGGTMVVHDADNGGGGGGGGFGTMVVNGDAAPGGSGGGGSMVVNPASASASAPSGAAAVPAFMRQFTGKAEQNSPANLAPRLDAAHSPRAAPVASAAPPARGDAGGRCAGCSSASASAATSASTSAAPSEREKSMSVHRMRQNTRDNHGNADKSNKYDFSHLGPPPARPLLPPPARRRRPSSAELHALSRPAVPYKPAHALQARTLQARHPDTPTPRCALQAWPRSTRSSRVSEPTWSETWASSEGNVRGRVALHAAWNPCLEHPHDVPPPPHPIHPLARVSVQTRSGIGRCVRRGRSKQARRRPPRRRDRARRDAKGPGFALRGIRASSFAVWWFCEYWGEN